MKDLYLSRYFHYFILLEELIKILVLFPRNHLFPCSDWWIWCSQKHRIAWKFVLFSNCPISQPSPCFHCERKNQRMGIASLNPSTLFIWGCKTVQKLINIKAARRWLANIAICADFLQYPVLQVNIFPLSLSFCFVDIWPSGWLNNNTTNKTCS